MTKLLEINLFGSCIVRAAGGAGYEITGAKQRGLFALLATAPFGRRTRSYLQDVLWGTSCFDSGRQSLRRALSDIKALMGPDYDRVLAVSNAEIGLNLDLVHFIGRPGGAEFLEGLDIRDNQFNEWLRGIRLAPEQLHALFSPRHQTAPRAMLPTIAVLPFRVVQGASDQTVLGDWLAEEVCRSLSRSNLLSVISHLSSRQMASQRLDLAEARRVLGVDYCVAGSLRISGGHVLLDADCLDARSGRILWTRSFDGQLAEFLAAESPPVAEVVRSIGQTVATEAVRHVHGRDLASLEDHDLLLAGVGLMHELRLSSFARSRALIEEAVRRAPRAAEAHAWLGEWYVMSVFNGWSTDRAADGATAAECCARALDIEPENSFALTIDGVVQNNLLMQLDKAGDRFDSALQRNPNESMAWLLSGVLAAYRDEGDEAVKRTLKARRLSPIDPFGYFYDALAASAHLVAGDYEQVVTLAGRSLASNGRHLSTLRVRLAALALLGRVDEARADARQMLVLAPDFSLETYRRQHPAAAFKSGQRMLEAMALAGIPERS